MHRSDGDGCAVSPRFREWSSHVPQRALDEPDQRFLDFQTTGCLHFRSVAFRHTEAMGDVVLVCVHLDVKDLNTNRREGADEGVEDSTLRWKAELDE